MKQQVQLQIARNEKRSIFLQCVFAWIYPPVIAAHVVAGKYYGLAYLAFAAAFIAVSHRGIKADIKLAIAQTQLDETLSKVADTASKLAASINHFDHAVFNSQQSPRDASSICSRGHR